MPKDLFDQDRLIWRIMGRMADICLLGFMWAVTCLPLITAGAACTGVYYVTLKIVRGEEGYLWKGYWKSFKQNFRQATCLWLVLVLLMAGAGFSIYYYYSQGTKTASGIMAFMTGVFLILILVFIYLFPILSRFSNTSARLFKMAFFMPFRHLGYTFILLAAFLLTAFLTVWITPYFLIGYGVYAYATSFVFNRIFAPYEEAIRNKNQENIQGE